jgi:hypothetical protein
MYCRYCGAEMKDGTRYCAKCGMDNLADSGAAGEAKPPSEVNSPSEAGSNTTAGAESGAQTSNEAVSNTAAGAESGVLTSNGAGNTAAGATSGAEGRSEKTQSEPSYAHWADTKYESKNNEADSRKQWNAYQSRDYQSYEEHFSERSPHGFAIASLVLGIIGLFFSLGFVVPILAIVFGVLGRNKAEEQPERYSGMGMATAGLILGIVSSALTILLMIAGFSFLTLM